MRDPGAHGGGSSYPAGPERSGSLSGTPCSTGAAGRRIPVCDRRARWALPVGGGGLDAQTRSGTSLQGAAVIPPFTGSAELPSPFPSALRTVADHGRRCAGRSLPGEGRTLRAIATTGGSGEGCIPAAGQVSIRVAGSFWGRVRWLLASLGRPQRLQARRRFLRALTKLAFCYWHVERAQAAGAQTMSLPRIPHLYEEVRRLRGQVGT